MASDIHPLQPGDTREEYRAPGYSREKRQEYNQHMGDFARLLEGATPERLAEFLSLTAEQERRWLSKRTARATSIGAARELLIARQFESIASRVKWPVKPSGYARRLKHTPAARMQTLPLSDLHIGANLSEDDNPTRFDFTTAGRRLAKLVYEAGEWKTQYRDKTTLNLGWNGDIIEGMLGHDDWTNAPLAEQMVAACHFLVQATTYAASVFPRVNVYCEPGNHGRNKLRHPGRATSSKWDGFESVIYKMAAAQCRSLANVKFHAPRAPALVIPLFDHNALMLHGDTELPLRGPSSQGGHKAWNEALNLANTPLPSGSPRFGAPVHVLVAGHFHDPALFPLDRGWAVSQGALVPSNGYARSVGYSDRCMFWLWESVEGFPVGDIRPLRVGPSDDVDSGLDAVIAPFAWD